MSFDDDVFDTRNSFCEELKCPAEVILKRFDVIIWNPSISVE